MKKIRCIIVDDEQFMIDMMADYVAQTPFLELVFSTTNPLLVVEWLGRHPAALCFADIEMPELNGLDLIRAVGGRCRFILCTAYPKYALQGYEHDVIDYLLKPVDYARFLKAATKALAQLQPGTPVAAGGSNWLFVQSRQKGTYIKIAFDDILYIESAKNFVHFYTLTEKIICHTNLKELAEQLPGHAFLRVHNSYIVALQHIERLEGNEIKLRQSNLCISVGGTYREALMAALNIKG
jgi:two-component system, LytTR family, response regulator